MRRKYKTIEQFLNSTLSFKEQYIVALCCSKMNNKKRKFRHRTFAKTRVR